MSPAPPEPPIAYLDHAATSPTRREVTEAMAPFAADRFGNASGSHRVARDARLALEDAREEIGALLGARPAEVVFTSGGTESDNLAVVGGWECRADRPRPPALVCAAMEHHAVLASCRALARRTGAELREVGTGKDGLIDLDALAAACTPDVGLVSVMAVNNEIGTVQPLEAVVALVRAG